MSTFNNIAPIYLDNTLKPLGILIAIIRFIP